MNKKERVKKIIEVFDRIYPDAGCSLVYKDPLQLLVAVQLSAQCTDAKVNEVTKTLFAKYKTLDDFADVDVKELEEEIKPTGFYRNKARNIKMCCQMIRDKFGGMIPDNLDDMLKLPGVGRKTANLVLGDVFGIPGIVVDTHAKRLSQRIGLTGNEDPVKIEFDLMEVVPKAEWNRFCHQLIFHGRAICTAMKPKCNKCPIIEYCDFGRNHS
ncbi:MAG: endonuclease III [Clostridiaceae bacterium]|nr:endonuclease III [Clostridiaceae bacterium]